jgi:hypothetical protein
MAIKGLKNLKANFSEFFQKQTFDRPLSQTFFLRGEEENPRRARCPCGGRSDFLDFLFLFHQGKRKFIEINKSDKQHL